MPERRLPGLGARIEPRWSAERSAAVRTAIERRARRRNAWVAGSLAALAACLVTALVVARSTPVPIARTTTAEGAPSSAVVVAIASATPLVDGTDLSPTPEGNGRSFVLRAGKARFVVPHDPSRPFRVQAGDVVVEDLGTEFTVAMAADGTVTVEVEEGRVRVRQGAAVLDVSAGERREIAPEAVSEGSSAGGRDVPAPAAPALPRWRALAESGRYDDAYQALRSAGPGAPRDDATELLVAADAARLGGHPAEAVPYLQRVVRGHARDPRAPLAAFTLGRVLLDDLGRPAEAADAFERARGAGGVLAEDALAREVEACSRAGDAARARALALEYARAYPAGRRARVVAKFGGVP
jgi:transmembrane sensor